MYERYCAMAMKPLAISMGAVTKNCQMKMKLNNRPHFSLPYKLRRYT